MPTLTTADGTTLAYRDESPEEPGPSAVPPVVLLHGLAGHLGEWDDLAARLLADGHRVVRYDARGHGASTRAPADMSRAAAVRDAVELVRALGLAPAVLLGQSLGGLTALLTAAAHPSLVTSLILVEAGPAGGDEGLPETIGGWLDSWPVPFPTREEAVAFLGHEAWARGLDWRADGGHARVDRATMVAAVAEPATQDYWEPWSRITCPTLAVRGEKGSMPAAEHTEMRSRRPSGTRLTVVPDAGHDVHLDRPDALYEAVTAFLAETAPEPAEHARFAAHLRALDEVAPEEEAALVHRILTGDPDRQMARSAAVRHLDRRATALVSGGPDAAWEEWRAGMTEAVRTDAFVTTRLEEWTVLHTLLTRPDRPWEPATLTAASDWLQRRLTETDGTPAPVLAFLAEHGRTRKVRAAAARRVG